MKNKNRNSKSVESLESFLSSGKRGFFSFITGRSGIIIILLLLQIGLLFLGFTKLNEHLHLLVGSSTLLAVIMYIYILNSSHNPSIKLTWCVLIGISPLFGTLLYFFILFEFGHRTVQRFIQKVTKESSEYFPSGEDELSELRVENKNAFMLSQYLKANGFPPYKNTSVRYFPLGEEKFEALINELKSAKKFIFIEYFIIADGRMWKNVLDILIKKVQEGVDVRLMYDGTCAFSSLPYSYPKKLREHGIKCKMFAPIRPLVSTHYNNRDHRKIVVIDGKTAFTGGINLADEYINEKVRFGHWKDTAIMVKGEAVRSFTLMFLQLWGADERERRYEEYLPSPEECAVAAEGYVVPYGDSPMDGEKIGEMVYLDMINKASEYVYFMSPYLILDNEMITALTFAAKRGVDVRIILPHIPDKKYAFCLAKTHYKELITSGVKIYEYTPGFIHAKVALYDDVHAVVGTINLDYRSLYHHFECAAYIYGNEVTSTIKADFANTEALSREVSLEDIKKEKITDRILGKLLKLIAPLM